MGDPRDPDGDTRRPDSLANPGDVGSDGGGAVQDPPGPSTVVDDDGRAKALRPIPEVARATALDAGLAAFARGEYFEAHELLEPAWMGTDDRAERNLYQGIIKVAAAGVHAKRGNAVGVRRNLEGARLRLGRADAGTARGSSGRALERVDLAALQAWVDRELVVVAASAAPEAARFAAAIRTWDRGARELHADSPEATGRSRG